MSLAHKQLPVSIVQPSSEGPVLRITNARVNKSSSAAFDGRFAGMHKSEDFAVYPLKMKEAHVTIQSETRIGWITAKGDVFLSPAIIGGANRTHLSLSVLVDKMNGEEMFHLLTCVSCAYVMKINAVKNDNVFAVAQELLKTR